jgi:chromosomal replication initiator protein
MESRWEEIKERVKQHLPQTAFKLWIEPMQEDCGASGQLVLGCPNPFFLHWVRSNYYSCILEEAIRLQGPDAAVHLTVLPAVEAAKKPPLTVHPGLPLLTPPSEPSRHQLNKSFTFEKFVVGDSNRLAFQASQALAADAVLYGHTLFLTSMPGLGKSHLSQAVGNFIQDRKKNTRVLYLTAEDFTNEMIVSLKNGRMDQFKDKYRRQCDTLLLEGVHFLSGKEKI